MAVESEPQSGDISLQNTAADREYFVFLDKRGKRWSKFRRTTFLIATLLFIGLIVFVKTLMVPSQLKLPTAVLQLKSHLKALIGEDTSPKSPPLWLSYVKNGKKATLSADAKTGSAGTIAANLAARRKKANQDHKPDEIHLGFYENWDLASLESLKENSDKLTHISPDWLTLTDGRGTVKVTDDQDVIALAKERGVTLLPMLTNMSQMSNWIPDVVEGLINGPLSDQEQFINSLIADLKTMGAAGVLVDFENIDPTYRDAMSRFLVKSASTLHDSDLELWLCIPMGKQLKIFDLDALAESVDYFVAMLHDENAETDAPGPIASWEWFNGWLDTLLDNYGEPSQWVIALGSFGYDWEKGASKEAETLGFEDVMSRALRTSLQSCGLKKPELNPGFSYENNGEMHTVWFLDAVTFYNQIVAAREKKVGGIGISRLGTEDPGIWQILSSGRSVTYNRKALTDLETINPGNRIANFDKGNFISMENDHTDGKRKVLVSSDPLDTARSIITENYEKFPGYLTIVHQKSVVDNAVAITFDDGPDSKWTPEILDILKAKGVKAAFFMIGANMEQYPSIVRRVLDEGHSIGIHTYTHPNIAKVSKERAYLEFNAAQRLLEAITGHSTVLFRPPYNADTNPREPDELVPIRIAEELGYVTVTEDIDTEDWSLPGTEEMIKSVKEGRILGGEVILMHDAGGDRKETVEALPQIIDYLRLRGDNITPLPDMIGVPPDQLMPVVQRNREQVTRAISSWGFSVMHETADFFWAFMIVATSLVVLRTLIVSTLAIRNRMHEKDSDENSGFYPPVSILIAAYNEEKVIEETLKSLLGTEYPGEIEILVVDDGSKDRTKEIVESIALKEGRVRIISQKNCGKAIALKRGLESVRNEIVVTLDADTQFEPGTVGELVKPLEDPLVGAVSGRAKVGNPHTMVARFQSLEYTCGFNLDRRAYHQLNCITVVPGAVCSLRKSAVLDAGGISNDTLAEDTDLTLALHRRGFKIAYASRAVAWTEAPETVRTFSKQRFRWAFGTLQCLWKHRDMLFDSRFKFLGWFSLPSSWFFNIFLVGVGPVIDTILLVSLFMSPANKILYFYFFIFLLADFLLAAVACRIEREPITQVKLILPMRFVYRPILSYAVLRSVLRALKGVWVGWGKLDRTASVALKVPLKKQ